MHTEHAYWGKKYIPIGDGHPGRFEVYYDPIEIVSEYKIEESKKIQNNWEFSVKYFIIARASENTGKVKFELIMKEKIYKMKIGKLKGALCVLNPEIPKVNIDRVILDYEYKYGSSLKTHTQSGIDEGVKNKLPGMLMVRDMGIELELLRDIRREFQSAKMSPRRCPSPNPNRPEAGRNHVNR